MGDARSAVGRGRRIKKMKKTTNRRWVRVEAWVEGTHSMYRCSLCSSATSTIELMSSKPMESNFLRSSSLRRTRGLGMAVMVPLLVFPERCPLFLGRSVRDRFRPSPRDAPGVESFRAIRPSLRGPEAITPFAPNVRSPSCGV